MPEVPPLDWALAEGKANDLPYRSLLDVMPAAAYTCDAEGLITYFNRRALAIWGRAPQLQDPVDRY